MIDRSTRRRFSQTSLLALAVATALVPQLSRAQAFQGSGTVDFGSATIDAATPNVTNVTVNTARATITWTPSDTGTGGGSIDFLPNGNVVNYAANGALGSNYVVLNRIIPTDTTRSVAFNGIVNSDAAGSIWFYSPGGLLIGSTARFNVGSLLLSAGDLAVDGGGDFMSTPGQFTINGASGSTSAIEIQPGAEIRAENAGQSNYVVAIAPRIQQDGLISARGSVALVAAESADFAVDSQGLFNITVSQGTEVSTNTFTHTGSTGGPDAAGAGEFRRVYMVAVPKNNAITMAIESGGAIGFDVAGSADLVGNTIVLAAGHNVADIANGGVGNPIATATAGVGTTDLTVARGSYTSNAYVRSATNASVIDTVAGGTPDISFASDLDIAAGSTALIRAQQGQVSIGGSLQMSGQSVNLEADAAASSLDVAGDLVMDAGSLPATGPAIGGLVRVQSTGADITVGGSAILYADAQTASNPSGSSDLAVGGSVNVDLSGGATLRVSGGPFEIHANAVSGDAGDNTGDAAGQAFGGSVSLTLSDPADLVDAQGGILIDASGEGGNAGASQGSGGQAQGGSFMATIANGAVAIGSGSEFAVSVSGVGGQGGAGANGYGGSASLIVDGGSLTTAGDYGLSIAAHGAGGDALSTLGNGGVGIGGSITVETRGTTGSIHTNVGGGAGGPNFHGIKLGASGMGGFGSAASSYGGSAAGGIIRLATTGAGQQIVSDSAMGVEIDVHALAGDAGSGVGEGGNASGGSAIFELAGGSSAASSGNLTLDASAQGGSGDIDGAGTARGGEARIRADGILTVANAVGLGAAATAQSGGTAASAFGGIASFSSQGGSVAVLGGSNFNVAATGGSGGGFEFGDAFGGTAEIVAGGGASLELQGDVVFRTSALGGDTGADFGGDAISGVAIVRAKDADVSLATSTANVHLMADAVPGTGDFPGQARAINALFETGGAGRLTLGGPIAGTAGDVVLTGNLVAAANPLFATLSAAGDVRIDQGIANTFGNSSLVLRAGNSGSPSATVIFGGGATVDLSGTGSTIDIYHNPSAIGSPTDYSAIIVNGALTTFQLIHNADDLQAINGFLGQSFALGNDIDASATAGWNGGLGFVAIGTDGFSTVSGAGFTGSFDGLGHTVGGLAINRPGQNYSGLFGYATGATIRDVNLTGSRIVAGDNSGGLIGWADGGTYTNLHVSGSFDGTGGNIGGLIGSLVNSASLTDSSSASNVSVMAGTVSVGGLVGYNQGTISRSWATGDVAMFNASNGAVGGLVGYNDGNISQTYATGNVSGIATNYAGGLIGHHGFGTVDRSYATGNVSGADSVGGLIGDLLGGTVSETYASGLVSGTSRAGGLIGNNQGATIQNSYWDEYATGQASGFGANSGSILSLDPVTSDPGQTAAPNYAFDPEAYVNFYPFSWTSFGGASRPVGVWEQARLDYGVTTIRSAHQLQFADRNLAGAYRLAFDIDATETNRLSGVWGNAGLFPIGDFRGAFTGTFDGAGHVIANLGINRATTDVGLFGLNGGTIRNLGLVNANVVGGSNYVGGLVANNMGSISGAFVTGSVNGAGSSTGGLVGANQNTGLITQSYSSATVLGANYAGGLVGLNAGSISFSYANGAVSAPNAGGLVGSNATLATIDASYWNTQASGVGNACGQDDGSNCGNPVGLTTAQSRQASSYAGWSLDSIGGQPLAWRIYEGFTAPLLKAFLRPLMVGPVDTTLVYDGTVPVLGAIPAGADPTHIFGTAAIVGVSRNAGTHAISYGGGLASDQLGYDLIAAPAAVLSITPAVLTLDAVSDTRTYDATILSGGAVLTTGLVAGDTVSGLTQSFDSANAGARTLNVDPGFTVNDGNGGANYTVFLNSALGSITPAPLTLAAVTDSRTYTGLTTSSGLVGVTGLLGADTVSGLTQSFDSANAGARTLGVDAGYTVNDGNGGGNYTVTLNTASGTITPAALTVTANDATTTYTASAFSGGNGVAYSGFVNGETATVLGGTLAYAGTSQGAVNAGNYAITPSGLTSGNYAISFVDGALTISPAALTLSAVADSRSYDATTASLAAVGVSGLQGSDTVTGLVQSFDSANAGARTLTVDGGYIVNDGNGGGNYTVSLVSAAGAITPATLTLAAAADSRSYDTTIASGGTVGVSGLFGADTVTGLTQSFDSANAGARTLSVDAGFSVNDGNGGGNYTVSTTAASGSITPAALTLSAVTDSRGYTGLTASAGTVGVTGLLGADTVTGLTQSFDSANAGARVLGVDAGYTVNDGNGGGNYAVSTITAPGTITPAPLTVTANGQVGTYTATAFTGGNGVTYAGFVNGETAAELGGTLAYSGNSQGAVNAGNYLITPGGLTSANYAISFLDGLLTINPALLTLDAVADSRTYDATTNSTGAVLITGLLGGDTVAGLGQSFDSANAGARTLSVNAGYTVNDGNAGGNYIVITNAAAGTITPATLTLSATSDVRGYDATTASAGIVAVSGLFGTDTVTGLTQSFDSANVGARTLNVNAGYTVADGNGGANYAITLVNASGSITPATLTLAATSDTRTYDATTASTGIVTVSGLLGTDTVTGLAQSFDSANAGARTLSVNAGYAVADGNGGANYAVTLTGAAGAITPASATVTYTATAASSVYGNGPGGLTGAASAAGLLGSDTLGSVTTGTAAFATAAGASSGVGTYAITGSGLAASTGNYTLSFVQAAANATALTVTARPLVVTANPQSRFAGDPDPALTFTVGGSGLVNGDSLTGALTSSATGASPAGLYPILQGTLAATPNYALTYVGADLTVLACTPAAGCGGAMIQEAAMEVASQVGTSVQEQQEETASEQEEKEEAAATSSGNPKIAVSSVIDLSAVDQRPAVNEQVSGTGNPTFWSQGETP